MSYRNTSDELTVNMKIQQNKSPPFPIYVSNFKILKSSRLNCTLHQNIITKKEQLRPIEDLKRIKTCNPFCKECNMVNVIHNVTSSQSTIICFFIFCSPSISLQILANDQLHILFYGFIYLISLHVLSITCS